MRKRYIGEIVTLSFEEDTLTATLQVTHNAWENDMDNQYTGIVISGDLDEGDEVTFNEVDLI